jgi:hypothetical protein
VHFPYVFLPAKREISFKFQSPSMKPLGGRGPAPFNRARKVSAAPIKGSFKKIKLQYCQEEAEGLETMKKAKWGPPAT